MSERAQQSKDFNPLIREVMFKQLREHAQRLHQIETIPDEKDRRLHASATLSSVISSVANFCQDEELETILTEIMSSFDEAFFQFKLARQILTSKQNSDIHIVKRTTENEES